MSVVRVALTTLKLAMFAARHPAVRAGLKAAPRLVPDETKRAAFEAAKSGAYSAGAGLRRVLPRSIVPQQETPPKNDH